MELRGVQVRYPGDVWALRGVDLAVGRGEFVAIVGLSGAGKSTLLRTVNRLVEPTAGTVWFEGEDLTAASPARLMEVRQQIGMIFQTFNLVKRSSVFRNVLAGRVGRVSTWRALLGLFSRTDLEVAFDALRKLEIHDKAFVRADALSGGQQQRVGIARALAQEPKVILADEPVASLDPPTSHMVMRDLRRINQEGITVLINLHFIDLAREYAQRIVGLRQGQVVYDGPAEAVDDATFEQIYGRALRADDFRGAAG
ncbi:MAG: phosphonate ABC transporter ATP-binding protein [Armatimonadota bacterium]|nr:phosphonate ABC transporter ATP-binding protein [Armatimonadota bacterium]MDR7518228.1 phosphonate ABC transporter ATP-binding protein [Armatimonadota bacterium]MDR7550752.1 phosphonate ABC transporter ATP-binding protein [Armatimonadota bacterium]